MVDLGQLSSVVPIGGYEMPEKINKFHVCNNVYKFQYDRPFHRGTKAKDNEFKVTDYRKEALIQLAENTHFESTADLMEQRDQMARLFFNIWPFIIM